MKHFRAPEQPDLTDSSITLFLAGSIEQGTAVDWQGEVVNALSHHSDDLVILNPRRENWDASWVQSINNPQFVEQVNWELDWLEQASIKAFYFAPGTKSPITFMEFGLMAGDGCVVCCPEGFWRKGNIEIVCDRYGIKMHTDMKSFIAEINTRVIGSNVYFHGNL